MVCLDLGRFSLPLRECLLHDIHLTLNETVSMRMIRRRRGVWESGFFSEFFELVTDELRVVFRSQDRGVPYSENRFLSFSIMK